MTLKPEAPSQVLLALGSNIAPETNLPLAVELLKGNDLLTLLEASSVWESKPVGDTNQAPFCNAAVRVLTYLSPRELKYDVLRAVEKRLHRVRDPLNKNGPRTIDIDIALFGDQVIQEEGLVVPDPEIPERPFLATPLAEVGGDLIHPLLHLSLTEIAKSVKHENQLKRCPDLIIDVD